MLILCRMLQFSKIFQWRVPKCKSILYPNSPCNHFMYAVVSFGEWVARMQLSNVRIFLITKVTPRPKLLNVSLYCEYRLIYWDHVMYQWLIWTQCNSNAVSHKEPASWGKKSSKFSFLFPVRDSLAKFYLTIKWITCETPVCSI